MSQSSEPMVYETRNFSKEGMPLTMHIGVRTTESVIYPNKHKDIEIMLITNGSGTVVSDLHHIKCREGDIVIINSGNIHYILPDDSIAYTIIVADFNILRKYTETPEQTIFCEKIQDININRIIKEMKMEYMVSRPYRNELLTVNLEKLIILLLQNYVFHGIDAFQDNKMISRIKKAIDYMESNLENDLDLEKIADNIGVSKYHFCREFKKAMGKTPMEYYKLMKCEMAKSLLATGKYLIADVAKMCRFSSPSHLSKAFKNAYGISPSDFVSSDIPYGKTEDQTTNHGEDK